MKGYLIGIDLGGANIKGAIYDLDYQLVIQRSHLTEVSEGSARVIEQIKNLVKELMSEAKLAFSSIKCMGMGIPGLLDLKTGTSLFSPNFPKWEKVPIAKIMEDYFGFPVFIDNDVRMNLYGEWKFGAGFGYKDLILITLGTGLGSGIVSDGKVVYGTTYSAGEIGHMNMYRKGRLCSCGSSGCLGRYVSALGMIRTFKEKIEEGKRSCLQNELNHNLEGLEAVMISDAYDQGDPLAREVMNETAELLGFGLSNVINLFNPEVIIIGGGMSAAGDRLLNPVRKTVKNHSLQLSEKACQIVQAKLGSGAGTMGAAVYAFEKLEGISMA